MTIEIPDEKATELRERLAEMESMYADMTRYDWYDADDIAIEVARYMAELLGN